MITKKARTATNNLIVPKPKSSLPKNEGSIHLDLQTLYSKKNIFESEVRVWRAKLATLQQQLKETNDEIREIEQYIFNSVGDAEMPDKKENHVKKQKVEVEETQTKIKVIEVGY